MLYFGSKTYGYDGMIVDLDKDDTYKLDKMHYIEDKSYPNNFTNIITPNKNILLYKFDTIAEAKYIKYNKKLDCFYIIDDHDVSIISASKYNNNIGSITVDTTPYYVHIKYKATEFDTLSATITSIPSNSVINTMSKLYETINYAINDISDTISYDIINKNNSWIFALKINILFNKEEHEYKLLPHQNTMKIIETKINYLMNEIKLLKSQ